MPNKSLATQALQETTSTLEEETHTQSTAMSHKNVTDVRKDEDTHKDEDGHKDIRKQIYLTLRKGQGAILEASQKEITMDHDESPGILLDTLPDVAIADPMEITRACVGDRYGMTIRSDDTNVSIIDENVEVDETERKWQKAFADFDEQGIPSQAIHQDVDSLKQYSNTRKPPNDSFMVIAKSSSSFAIEHDIDVIQQYSNTTKIPDGTFMVIAKSSSSFDIAHDTTQSQNKTSIEDHPGAHNTWRWSSHFQENYTLRPIYLPATSPAGQAEDTISDTWSTTRFNDEHLISDDKGADIVGSSQLESYLAAISKEAMTHSEKMTKDEWITPRSAGPRL